MLPNNPPFFLDENHPANQDILKVMRYDLGEPTPPLIQFFDECLLYLLRVRSHGKGMVGPYPVFVEGNSGGIIAAVLGKYAVALHYPSSGFREDALAEGAKPIFEFGGSAVNLGEEWAFTTGGLDLKKVRNALPTTMEWYQRKVEDRMAKEDIAQAIAKGGQSPVNPSHASNVALTEFFQKLHPKGIPSSAPPMGYGGMHMGMHPDIPDYFWNIYPQQAGIRDQVKTWLVYSAPVLVHSQTGIILAYATGKPTIGLRLPEKGRLEFAECKIINMQPELGPEWVTYDMFRNEPDTLRWMTWAYEYAGQG